jgi:hypothetical protein
MLNTLRFLAFTAMEWNAIKYFYYVNVNTTIPLLSPQMIGLPVSAPFQMNNYLLLKGRSCGTETHSKICSDS